MIGSRSQTVRKGPGVIRFAPLQCSPTTRSREAFGWHVLAPGVSSGGGRNGNPPFQKGIEARSPRRRYS